MPSSLEGAAAAPDCPVLAHVVVLHAEELAMLRVQRSRLLRSPAVDLPLLARHDERIAAHLDGIAVAGEAGRRIAAGIRPGLSGEHAFAATAAALVSGDAAMLREWVERTSGDAEARRMVESAFGFVAPMHLRGVVASLLEAADPGARAVGLFACASHGVEPGPALARAFEVDHAVLQAQACTVAAKMGRIDLVPACLGLIGAADPGLASAAARSACRLGDRDVSLDALRRLSEQEDPDAEKAIESLLIAAASPADAETTVQRQAQLASGTPPGSVARRRAVRSAGMSGSVACLPWLVDLCADPGLKREAAMAIVSITGVDLEAEGLLGRTGEPVSEGDGAVAFDDWDLPLPDAVAVASWWSRSAPRVGAAGRLFLGRELRSEAWIEALHRSTQPHRARAALHLAHAHPGQPWFDVAAPGRVQQARLGALAPR